MSEPANGPGDVRSPWWLGPLGLGAGFVSIALHSVGAMAFGHLLGGFCLGVVFCRSIPGRLWHD